MTLRHMNIFVVVAELGSMGAAAKQLFISQPAVSQAISELETHYQTLLFDRLGSSMTVGTCLMPDIISEMKQAQPLLNVYSLVNNTAEIEQGLLNSSLDAAVVEGDIQSPHLVSIPIISDQLVLLCGKAHPFFQNKGSAPLT